MFVFNRLCLLTSNPLPPLINRHPWFFMIQCSYFILILALATHTYTIHTCIYTVYIPIPYLFYTCILYFYSVLYFNQKYIWFKPPFYTCLVSTSLLMWWWIFEDIMPVSRSGVLCILKITKSSMKSRTYFILQTSYPKLFPLWDYCSLSSNPERVFCLLEEDLPWIRQRQKNVMNLTNYFTSRPRRLLSILLIPQKYLSLF